LKTFFEDDANNQQYQIEIDKSLKQKQIDNEINNFRMKILDEMFKSNTISTIQFWKKYTSTFPNLSKLALILLTTQSSPAFIERFFSICGVVCKPKASNMKDGLIITRSMLKANI
jgi:hypothetical protein